MGKKLTASRQGGLCILLPNSRKNIFFFVAIIQCGRVFYLVAELLWVIHLTKKEACR